MIDGDQKVGVLRRIDDVLVLEPVNLRGGAGEHVGTANKQTIKQKNFQLKFLAKGLVSDVTAILNNEA